MGYPWPPPPAEKQALEPGSWVTCDRDSIPHRLDESDWGCRCLNPVPALGYRSLSDEEIDKIARGLAEPDPPAEQAAYDRGWNDAIDVFMRNIKASNFERRR